MTSRTSTAPDLTAALEDLNVLGSALVRNFHAGVFPACTRLARNVRAANSPRTVSSAFPDTITRADAMLVQVKSLQSAITRLAGLGKLHELRLARVAEILAAYRASLEPEAAAEPLAA
jgi:hypothetical protein